MITTRKACFSDLETMLAIEKIAIKSHYLAEVYTDFFTDDIGKMIVAEEDGIIYGFGKITIQYDGSAWLELLRVSPEHQNKGAGKAIWKEFLAVATKNQPKYIRMYTGVTNIISKHIAELNGVNRAYEFSECSHNISTENAVAHSFKLANYEDIAHKLPEIRKTWGNYCCFNRTFYAIDEALLKALCQEKKVFYDGESLLALGSRFMPERGINLGFMIGNMENCLAFAKEESAKRKVPKLIIMHRAVDLSIKALTEKSDFEYLAGNLLMLEGDFA